MSDNSGGHAKEITMMHTIDNKECCTQREGRKILIESLVEEIANLKINLRNLQDRLDGREQARIERMIPQPGESLD